MNSFTLSFARLAAMARRIRRTIAPCVARSFFLAALFAAGCRSLDKPASASFASVVLPKTYSLAQIQQASVTVFRANGYQNVPQPDNTLVFERGATQGEQLSYAGLAGTQWGQKVIIRVRVDIVVRDASTYWLGCKAYAVLNPDQPVSSTTTALFDFQSEPYQKLLDEVKGTLQRPAATP